jgi:transcriptional regulator
MYIPTAFKNDDLADLHGLIDQTRLAIIVTHDENGLHASHVPLLLRKDQGRHGTLYGHLAKANSQWRSIENGAQALVIFAGPDAYVSPSSYATKTEHGKVVPTWNYVAVHASGVARVFAEKHRLLEVVKELTKKHEQGRDSPWEVDDAPADYIDKMLGAIVGFALPIEHLEGKRKLSQNRSAADIAGVRDGLAASVDFRDQELAHLMT